MTTDTAPPGAGFAQGGDQVIVGWIVRPHGNKGHVVVKPETDFAETRFVTGAVLTTAAGRSMTVTAVRLSPGRFPVIGFDGVATISEAELLRGLELKMPAAELHPLPAGGFYVHDLVGCRVETTAGATVGTVTDVNRGTGTPVLVIAGERGEVLVPLAEEICRRVDIAARVVVIDPPEGLLEINASGRG